MTKYEWLMNMLITCYRWEKDANKQCKRCCDIGIDFIVHGTRQTFKIAWIFSVRNILEFLELNENE